MTDEQPALYALSSPHGVVAISCSTDRHDAEMDFASLGWNVPTIFGTGYTVVRVKVVEVEEPDQSAALQRAIDKAAEESPQVFIKPGRYGDINVRVSEVEE